MESSWALIWNPAHPWFLGHGKILAHATMCANKRLASGGFGRCPARGSPRRRGRYVALPAWTGRTVMPGLYRQIHAGASSRDGTYAGRACHGARLGGRIACQHLNWTCLLPAKAGLLGRRDGEAKDETWLPDGPATAGGRKRQGRTTANESVSEPRRLLVDAWAAWHRGRDAHSHEL